MSKKKKEDNQDIQDTQEYTDLQVAPLCPVMQDAESKPFETKSIKDVCVKLKHHEKVEMVDANNVKLLTSIRSIDKVGRPGIVIFPGARVRVRADAREGSQVLTCPQVAFDKGLLIQGFDGEFLQVYNSSGTRITLQDGEKVAVSI